MENIKVSVIVPVYNSDQYLETCLNSLLRQTLHEIEIICVDDGSSDYSCQILDEYAQKDERLCVLHQINQYAGVARNNGFAVARGEYVCFFDSDDFFDLTLLKKAYSKAKSSNADIVIFGAKKYHTDTKTFERTNLYFDRKYLPKKKVFSYKDISDHIMMLTTPAPWTKLYRREFIQEQKLQFQSLQNSNDAYFTLLSMCVAKRISYVNEDLVYYRVGQSNNLQSRKSKYPTCFIEAYKALYEELNHRGIFNELEKSYVDVVLSGCAYNLDTTAEPQARLKICEAISNSKFLVNDILNHSESYYTDKEQYNKVKSCLDIWSPYKQELKICADRKKDKQVSQGDINKPSVSVIIPVYNTEDYIAECLQSVCRQTLKNIEIIIVNDGTQDHSMEIVNIIAAEDARIKIINKENGGLSSARNVGMKAAAGEYILFLDSDDILCEVALELLYWHAKSMNQEDLFFSAVSFSDDECEQTDYLKYADYYKRKGDYSGTWKGTKLFTKFVENGEFRSSACLQFIKKSFLFKYNILFYEGIIHEDNLFTMQCLLNSERVGFLNLDLYFRRIHNNSIMTQKKGIKNAYGYYICITEMLKSVESCTNSCDEEYAIALENQFRIMIDESYKFLENLSNEEVEQCINSFSIKDRILFKFLMVRQIESKISSPKETLGAILERGKKILNRRRGN